MFDKKYALIELNRITEDNKEEALKAIEVLKSLGCLTEDIPESKDEFIVFKLKDKNTDVAISAYATKCSYSEDTKYLMPFLIDKHSRAGKFQSKTPD